LHVRQLLYPSPMFRPVAAGQAGNQPAVRPRSDGPPVPRCLCWGREPAVGAWAGSWAGDPYQLRAQQQGHASRGNVPSTVGLSRGESALGCPLNTLVYNVRPLCHNDTTSALTPSTRAAGSHRELDLSLRPLSRSLDPRVDNWYSI
jgi:hypothetical protein